MAGRQHDLVVRATPHGWLAVCTCGFSRSGRTRNALGRASAMRAAERQHERLVEAEGQ